MIESLLRNLRARDTVSAAEETTLRSLFDTLEIVPPRSTIIRSATRLYRSVLLLDGFICRFKDLGDGRRQISAIHVPGDFVDLHGYTLKYLDHDVASLSRVEITSVPHTRIDRVTESEPHLTRMLWALTDRDAARHREWEVSLGAREGLARIAHLFCELYHRLALVDRLSGNGFALPISQTELGECAGLTNVHTNRVLQELRTRRLVDFRSGRVLVFDLGELERVAEFDPLYLYLPKGT